MNTAPTPAPTNGAPVATATPGTMPLPMPSAAAPMVLAASQSLLAGDAFRMALEPTTLEQAFNIAGIIATCRICGCETTEDALVRIMTGRSLGLTTMQSLRGVYVVNGRPGLDATLMHAICIAAAAPNASGRSRSRTPRCKVSSVAARTPRRRR